jgi:ATPase subunit of ABC transporter with duplicated ATPase domains
MQTTIFLNHISLYFPNKIYFEDFLVRIQTGSRIAVVRNNETGKLSLLKIIKGDLPASEGEIQNKNAFSAMFPQLIYEYENLAEL